jgi:hypothetical protein
VVAAKEEHGEIVITVARDTLDSLRLLRDAQNISS